MLNLGSLGETYNLDISTSDAEWENTTKRTRFVVRADVNCHLRIGHAATTDKFKLVENEPAEILITPGAVLHAIVADGETDGVLQIAEA